MFSVVLDYFKSYGIFDVIFNCTSRKIYWKDKDDNEEIIPFYDMETGGNKIIYPYYSVVKLIWDFIIREFGDAAYFRVCVNFNYIEIDVEHDINGKRYAISKQFTMDKLNLYIGDLTDIENYFIAEVKKQLQLVMK